MYVFEWQKSALCGFQFLFPFSTWNKKKIVQYSLPRGSLQMFEGNSLPSSLLPACSWNTFPFFIYVWICLLCHCSLNWVTKMISHSIKNGQIIHSFIHSIHTIVWYLLFYYIICCGYLFLLAWKNLLNLFLIVEKYTKDDYKCVIII